MKKKNYIIIFIFISFLYLPTIVYFFIGDLFDNNNYENRELFQKPNFSLKNISNFSVEYENYYNDNLPFKNQIRKLRANILYHFFKTSNNSKVIIGKDNWLFYGIDEEKESTILDYRKTTKFSKKQKKEITSKFSDQKNIFNSNNIDFYLWIIPNKENVYSDYMPSIISRNANSKYSKTEDLINYINENSDLDVIYPKKDLINNRRIKDTYFKYDTHWNNYGAYIGTSNLIENIESSFDRQNILFGITNKSGQNPTEDFGDLAKMNSLPNLRNSEPTIENFYDSYQSNCNYSEDYNLAICNSEKSLYNKTILVVGDSFRKASIQYISKLYKNSIFIDKHVYNQNNQDHIKQYNPDIVIYEVVERATVNLLDLYELM